MSLGISQDHYSSFHYDLENQQDDKAQRLEKNLSQYNILLGFGLLQEQR